MLDLCSSFRGHEAAARHSVFGVGSRESGLELPYSLLGVEERTFNTYINTYRTDV